MQIESYRFGRIVVDGHPYTHDLIIYPDRVQSNWWRQEGHELHPGDLQDVLTASPHTLIVGTGSVGRLRILQETEELFQQRGIHLIALRTEAACQAYNQLRQRGERVVAALHLTC